MHHAEERCTIGASNVQLLQSTYRKISYSRVLSWLWPVVSMWARNLEQHWEKECLSYSSIGNINFSQGEAVGGWWWLSTLLLMAPLTWVQPCEWEHCNSAQPRSRWYLPIIRKALGHMVLMFLLILMRHMSDTALTIHIKSWFNKITHEVLVGFCSISITAWVLMNLSLF